MKQKPEKSNPRTLILWSLFGIGVAFSATVLAFFILQDFANSIPMSITIGILIGFAFILFTNKMRSEDKNN